MACMKLGSKADAFRREGNSWFCTTGLPSDITIEVGEVLFHLHKFPLLSKSGLLEKLIREKPEEGEEGCSVNLTDIPFGPKAFELAAKFCYNIKFELTASNVVYLRCAADYLEMTEEISEGNLVSQSDDFLNRYVLRGWKDTIRALQTCDDVLPQAEELQIVKRLIESLARKASTDPNMFGWPIMQIGPSQSPGGSVLWNGISTGAKPINRSSDWWYEDVSSLSLPLYKKLISVMESRGVTQELIAGSLSFYAKRHLPGLNRRESVSDTSCRFDSKVLASSLSEEEQKHLLEEIDQLLPFQKGLASSRILFGLLRTAIILRASEKCLSNLERRIGMQLDQAALEDLLIPNISEAVETLYDVDRVQRILDHFVAMDQDNFGGASPALAHPWLQESEREELCRLMDCQKLSLEACTHAAQNERLPLRAVVQVLFFEQLHLRSSIAGCLLMSDNLDGSRPLQSGVQVSNREHQVLKLGMDSMRNRVSELEKECSSLREDIEKLGREKKKLGFRIIKSQICSSNDGLASKERLASEEVEKQKHLKQK
ncbi:BTB/POZ domain-containing protein [Ananas comosus]|uniref:BTB/POZ domain-containing protein n=1 Tax=Ananas comosus TaxID=4615 RepID=A0A199VXT3_ANACO|nr:BTB/POZ domain-containing protein [Ananas comosus]